MWTQRKKFCNAVGSKKPAGRSVQNACFTVSGALSSMRKASYKFRICTNMQVKSCRLLYNKSISRRRRLSAAVFRSFLNQVLNFLDSPALRFAVS